MRGIRDDSSKLLRVKRMLSGLILGLLLGETLWKLPGHTSEQEKWKQNDCITVPAPAV